MYSLYEAIKGRGDLKLRIEYRLNQGSRIEDLIEEIVTNSQGELEVPVLYTMIESVLDELEEDESVGGDVIRGALTNMALKAVKGLTPAMLISFTDIIQNAEVNSSDFDPKRLNLILAPSGSLVSVSLGNDFQSKRLSFLERVGSALSASNKGMNILVAVDEIKDLIQQGGTLNLWTEQHKAIFGKVLWALGQTI